MDPDRLASLARRLARGGSRRGVGRDVLVGAFLGLLGKVAGDLGVPSDDPEKAAAKPGKGRGKCRATCRGKGKRRRCCRPGKCRPRNRPGPPRKPGSKPKRRPKPRPRGGPVVSGCPVFPANNVWNTRITNLPVHPRSDAFIRSIGLNEPLGPDFSIPYGVVSSDQPEVLVRFDGGANEIHHQYPIPPDVPIEPAVDRHVVVVDRSDCHLYELYHARRDVGNTWRAYSGASWNLRSNVLRPDGMTSADAAGLPILAGLVRYNEVTAGWIGHAIRVTAPRTRAAHVWPARKHASHDDNPNLPSMGQRFRLRADFDISGFTPHNQVILTALKHYGFMLADNGGPWVFQGVPDPRWNEAHLEELRTRVHGRDFEAVMGTALMVSPNSGLARANAQGRKKARCRRKAR